MRLKFERQELKEIYKKTCKQITSQISRLSLLDIALASALTLTLFFSGYAAIQTRNLERKLEKTEKELKTKIEVLEAQRKEAVEKTYFDDWGFIDTLRARGAEIELEDIDRDGDLDIVIKDVSGIIRTYENVMPVKFLPEEKKLLAELILKLKAKGHDIEPYLEDKRFKYYRDIRELLYGGKKISEAQHQKNLRAYVKKYLDDATDFMMQNQFWLNKAKNEYGVEPWDIVSVLNKETRLGKQKGVRSIFNSLISILLTLPSHKNFVYRNLKVLLELSEQEGKDIFSYKGSFMGAYEWPQSLLENISRFGVDLDSNGRIDLSTLPDAIGFIANYLAKAGYRLNRYGSIYSYNHSHTYCDYIIALGNALKSESHKRHKLFDELFIREVPFYTAEKDKTNAQEVQKTPVHISF